MANLALALDEIISQTKPTKRAGVRGGGRITRAGAIQAAIGEGPRTSARTRFPQKGFVSGEVPAGRWKHDKYFETYGAKKGAAKTFGLLNGKRERIPRLASVRSKPGGGIGARLARKAVGSGQSGMVKMQILSLPESVITSDLEVGSSDFFSPPKSEFLFLDKLQAKKAKDKIMKD